MCTTTGEGGANTCKQGMGLCVQRQRRGELIHVSKVWDCVYTDRGGGGASKSRSAVYNECTSMVCVCYIAHLTATGPGRGL